MNDCTRFTAAIAALGLHEHATVLAAEWEASQDSLPATIPYFLEQEYVTAACRDAHLLAEVETAAAARRIAAHPDLRALAWHCRHCLYDCPTYPSHQIWRWPSLAGALEQDAGLFYLLVLLAGMPTLRSVYRDHAIPEHVARDTLFDVQRRLIEYRAEHGQWGLAPRHLTWLRNHLNGAIYHLVRLQFAPGPLRASVRAYRHHGSGAVIALSEDGVRYRADGQIDGAGGVFDPTGAWTARLRSTEQQIVAAPVMPAGYARREEVRLPAEEWQQVLAPGDPVLHIHIPAGSPMDFDRCGQSLLAALDFFPRHFPDQPFNAFACSSWLLDLQFEALLPPSSNIVRFQQEVYLLPGNSDGRNTLVRVFGHVPDHPARAPRDTTLRRAIVDHLANGGHLRGGRCFLLREDLRWGEQVYRRQRLPVRP